MTFLFSIRILVASIRISITIIILNATVVIIINTSAIIIVFLIINSIASVLVHECAYYYQHYLSSSLSSAHPL